MSARTKLVLPLVAWTLFVWTSRIRNIWTDDSLNTNGQIVRTIIACVFLGFAVTTARVLWIRRGDALGTGDRALLIVFVAWTIGFWLIRGIGIIIDDHTASFTAIHTALMVFSIGVALLAARAIGAPASASPALATATQR